MDFISHESGILIARSKPIQANQFAIWYSFATDDGGANWTSFVDTIDDGIMGAGIRGAKAMRYYPSGEISVFANGAHIFSIDNGISWASVTSPFYNDKSVFLHDVSSIHRFVTQLNEDNRSLLMASYDSGAFYEPKNNYDVNTQYGFVAAAFYDTNTVWTTVGASSQADSNLKWQVHYTGDAGGSWIRHQPFGESSVRNSFLSAYGIVPGVNKGTLYILGNVNDLTKPSPKLIDILYTTDFGETWVSDTTNTEKDSPDDLLGMGLKTRLLYNNRPSELWSVFWDNHTLAYSSNNGMQWYYDDTTFASDSILFMHWEDSTTGYVVTYSKSTTKLYKYTPYGSTVEHHRMFANKIYYNVFPQVVTNGSLNINAVRELNGIFEIYDVFGRQLYTELVAISAKNKMTINIENMSDGVYFLFYRVSGNTYFTRFLKQ